jgi:hypothetical protein
MDYLVHVDENGNYEVRLAVDNGDNNYSPAPDLIGTGETFEEALEALHAEEERLAPHDWDEDGGDDFDEDDADEYADYHELAA